MKIERVITVGEDRMMEYTLDGVEYRVYWDSHFDSWEHARNSGQRYRSCERKPWVEGVVLYYYGGDV